MIKWMNWRKPLWACILVSYLRNSYQKGEKMIWLKNLTSPLLSWKERYSWSQIKILERLFNFSFFFFFFFSNFLFFFLLLMYYLRFSMKFELNNERNDYETGMFKRKQSWVWHHRLSALILLSWIVYRFV